MSCTRGFVVSDGHLRSAADDDAAHSVGEAIGEQAGNVIVHDLHLAALEFSHLIQADLVLLRVLGERRTWRNARLEKSLEQKGKKKHAREKSNR